MIVMITLPMKKSIPTTPIHDMLNNSSTQFQCDIDLKIEKVQSSAFSISQLNLSYDVLCWMCGEMDARLEKAVLSNPNPLNSNKFYGIQVDRSKIVMSPKDDEIRPLAQGWAVRGLSFQDLHWALAVRNNLFDQC